MQVCSYYKYITFVTITVSFSMKTMEDNKLTLKEYINHYKEDFIRITPPTASLSIITDARNNMRNSLKNCQTEHDVYNYMSQNYTDARNNLMTFLQQKRFICGREFTDTVIERIENAFNKGESNTLISDLPEIIDDKTIIWNGYKWKNTTLVPSEKLGIIYACADFLGIDERCFITVQTPVLSDAIMIVGCEQYTFGKGFILGLSEDSVNALSSNPLLIIHILLHEFTHLKKGDGAIRKTLELGTHYFQRPNTKGLAHESGSKQTNEKINHYIENLELRADIESIINPGNDRLFTLDEKKIIYQVAVQCLCDRISKRQNTSDEGLLHLQTLIRLYDIVNVQGDIINFQDDRINIQQQFTLFGFKIFRYK